MTKLRAFAAIDYLTVRTSLPIGYLLILAAMVVFFAYAQGPGMSMGIGMLFALMFINYPFAIGEKSNMDALYATLSLDRKSVVAGRYLFILALNISAFAAVFILTMITMLVLGVASLGEVLSQILTASAGIGALVVVIQATQLPIYFKLGYDKGKMLSLVPLLGMYGIFIGYNLLTNYIESDFAQRIMHIMETLNTPAVIALAVLLIAAIAVISYRLSVAFYSKREF